MAVALEYAPGATPIDPDEAAGLIPDHITTQAQLDQWESDNVSRGLLWAFDSRKQILSLEFMYGLHQKMFGDTWKWAGKRRWSIKTIGIAPEYIDMRALDLLRDAEAQIDGKVWSIDEVAARLAHRMVQIHPFPNGNGRHSRAIADVLLRRHGRDVFTWGNRDLVKKGPGRDSYIQALRAADRNDYSPLLALVRSA